MNIPHDWLRHRGYEEHHANPDKSAEMSAMKHLLQALATLGAMDNPALGWQIPGHGVRQVAEHGARDATRAHSAVLMAASTPRGYSNEYYRADGVKILHDPYAPGMVEKYGRPQETDAEGFDPYRDSVGPGIYGGIVKRDPATGEIVIGEQYQNHNTKPGPVYAGGGYTPINNALRQDESVLKSLLDKYPDLVNDVSTGGATPLHFCGMAEVNQGATAYLISRNANIEALDTYGMTPLHRMASNNLAIGAEALLKAGADANNAGECGQTPLRLAQMSHAYDVLDVIAKYEGGNSPAAPKTRVVSVHSSGEDGVNQRYEERDPAAIPEGFAKVCRDRSWDSQQMWRQLSDQQTPWFEAANGAYIYWNRGDGQWWIDAPNGLGVYVTKAPNTLPPSQGWSSIGGQWPCPTLEVLTA